jgi:hypothetical protein
MRMAKAEGFKTVGSGLYSWIAGRTHNGYQEVIYFSDDVTRAVKHEVGVADRLSPQMAALDPGRLAGRAWEHWDPVRVVEAILNDAPEGSEKAAQRETGMKRD